MPVFHTILLVSKPGDPSLRPTLESLRTFLHRRGRRVLLDASACTLLRAHAEPPCADGPREPDLVLAVGGDGTLLHAARRFVDRGIPLAGINRGRLGFLADISPDEMLERMEEILSGRYQEDQRTMLCGRILRNETEILASSALNDIVLHARQSVRMIGFDVFVDGRLLARQNADGIVVATPTGSTAYALSGGGPILHPDVSALTLVPICPHTLSNRPIVIDDRCRMELALCPDNTVPAVVSFDGQVDCDLEPGDRVEIWLKERRLRLIQPADLDYFEILRAKLKWSELP